MAVTFRSASSGPAVAPTALGRFTLPKPTGTQPGDVLVAILYQEQGGSAADINPVAGGWIPVSDSAALGSWVGNGKVFGRTVGQSDPDNYDWQTTISKGIVGNLLCFTDTGTTTTTYNAVWSTSWNRYGRHPQGNDFLYQGSYSYDAGGWNWSKIGFPAQVQTDLAGKTIVSCELFLKNLHSYYNPSMDAWVGTHDNGATSPADPGFNFGNPNERWHRQTWEWAKGSGFYANLGTAFGNDFKSGAATGITLGHPEGGDLQQYGYFASETDADINNRPKLRITYQSSSTVGVQLHASPTWAASTTSTTTHTSPLITPVIISGAMQVVAYMAVSAEATHSYTPSSLVTERTDTQSPGKVLTLSTDTRSVVPQGDIAVNPSFVTNTTGWVVTSTGTGTTTLTRLTGLTIPGTATTTAGRLTRPATTGDAFMRNSPTITMNDIVPGDQCRVTAIVRSDGTATPMTMGIRWFTSGDVFVSETSETFVVTANTWTPLTGSAQVAPATAARCNVTIGRVGAGANALIDATDVTLRRTFQYPATFTRSTGYLSMTLMLSSTTGPSLVGDGSSKVIMGTTAVGTVAGNGTGLSSVVMGTSASTGTTTFVGAASAVVLMTTSGTGFKQSASYADAVVVMDTYGVGFNPNPQPYVQIRLRVPDPLPRVGRRFIVQSALTREILSWSLPIRSPRVTTTLSGPGGLTGKLEPAIARDVTSGSNKILEPWGTLLHFEEDGEIRGTYILVPPSTMDSNTWSIEAEGFSTYPHGIPYDGEYSKIGVDPLDVVREIWRHVQSWPSSNLKVVVGTDTTDVRLGTPAHKDDKGNDVKEAPYTLNWWDDKKCGEEINTLAKSTPFEYREISSWNEDKTDVRLEIDVDYPRTGTYREDLRFVEGENILLSVPITEADDWYADVVIGNGAGEGRAKIRVKTPAEFHGVLPRLRRVHIYDNPNITDKGEMERITRDEVTRRLAVHEIASIVIDGRHKNAPLGSFQVGDDILVQAEVPWVGRTALKHRIVKYTYDLETDVVQLDLKRSDAFRYGKEGLTK